MNTAQRSTAINPQRVRVAVAATDAVVGDVGDLVGHRAGRCAAEDGQQRVVPPGEREESRRAEPDLERADVVQKVAVVRLEVADVVEEGDGSDDRPEAEDDCEQPEGGEDDHGDEVDAGG